MNHWAVVSVATASTLAVGACGGASGPAAAEVGIDGGRGVDAGGFAGEAASVDAAGDAREAAGVDDAAAAVEAAAADAGAAPCSADSVAGIAVATETGQLNPLDPLGYPPYALDGCTLAYVAPAAPGQAWGELRLRQLSTGDETQLAPASERPRRPAIAGDLVAWEAIVAGKSVVRVSKAGQTITLSGPFDHAGEPRVASDAVVFTAWLSADDLGDTDVYLYMPAAGKLAAIATGPGQQRFADVSTSLVAVSDFSEDPSPVFVPGALHVADIVVFNRQTLAKTVRHLPGKQAFPMLGSGTRFGYLDWGFVVPEPKFSAYTVRVGDVASDPASDGNVKGSGQVNIYTPYVRPSVHGDWIEWVDESMGGGGLFGRPLDFSLPPSLTLGGRQFVGPVAGQSFTIVAVTSPGRLQLRGVAR
jgi:hypothetical protein